MYPVSTVIVYLLPSQKANDIWPILPCLISCIVLLHIANKYVPLPRPKKEKKGFFCSLAISMTSWLAIVLLYTCDNIFCSWLHSSGSESRKRSYRSERLHEEKDGVPWFWLKQLAITITKLAIILSADFNAVTYVLSQWISHYQKESLMQL